MRDAGCMILHIPYPGMFTRESPMALCSFREREWSDRRSEAIGRRSCESEAAISGPTATADRAEIAQLFCASEFMAAEQICPALPFADVNTLALAARLTRILGKTRSADKGFASASGGRSHGANPAALSFAGRSARPVLDGPGRTSFWSARLASEHLSDGALADCRPALLTRINL